MLNYVTARQSINEQSAIFLLQSLEVLVRQMRATEPEIVRMVLHQFQKSVVWKHRAASAKLLVLIGRFILPCTCVPPARWMLAS